MYSLPVSAQKPSNEFSIYGGGGAPVILSSSASSSGFGGDIGLGFTTFLGQQVAVHVGAGLGLSNVTIKADNLKTITPGLIDDDNNGYLYDLHTTLSGYSEVQKATFLNIPVMLQFQPKQERLQGYYVKRTLSFYAMGGAKLLFWHQTKYESSVATLSNAAYYPKFKNWTTTQKFAGLGTFDGNSTTGNFKLGLLTVLTLEAGMKWQIDEKFFLYTGAYLDYGLNDPAKNQRKPLGSYTAAEQLTDLTLLAFADKINLMTVGVKLRLAYFHSTTLQVIKIPKRKRSTF
jgi:hypothetical protein